MHGTDAALRDAASEFRSGQADVVTQDPQQRSFRLRVDIMRRAINR
jgi:hypothetical protein